MKTRIWKRTAAVTLIVLVVSACSEATAPTSTDPTQPPNGGSLADYMNDIDAAHLDGIQLRRDYVTDRLRVVGDTEESFVVAVRDDSAHAVAIATFDALDDEALVYLGYLYCLARDADQPIDRSVAVVVDVVTQTGGRSPRAPADEDFIAAVTIVNHASGSLCPERFVDTNAFLKELTNS